MSEKDQPEGQLFSRVYLDRGTPARDSPRFRNRLASYCQDQIHIENRREIGALIRRELGITLQHNYYVSGWFLEPALRDVLDTITLVWRHCKQRNQHHVWHAFVQRVMREENIGYRLDDEAGVHYYVDEEFERNRFATLENLSDAQYAAVANLFESAHGYLDDGDARAAVRSVFDAVEVLSKQMVGGKKITSLGATNVEKHLKPIARQVYTDTAWDAANQLLNGLADWINSIQPYRHGQKDPHPPMDLAIAMVSSGASYLRWLVEIDQQANG